MEKTFDEYKKEVQDKLPEGFVLDENQMDKLKEAFDKGEKINEQDFAKKETLNKDNNKENANKKTITVNEGAAAEVSTDTNSAEASWKETYATEWKLWGEENNLKFQDASIPTKGGALSFRFFEGKETEYAAEITYTSPYNLSIRGNNGKIPDNRYFEKAVNMAVKNGTAIEFGNISSPEFKAKLLAACYKQGNIQIVNGPTPEEMAAWPEELKKMVADAKAANQQPQEQTQQKQEQKPEVTPEMKRIAELRKQIQTRQSKLEEATKDGKTLSAEEQKAIEQEGMSAEEIKLRELRGQAKAGDKKAAHELDSRRYDKMTDEYKYKRLTKEENGKEIFVKDDDGNYMYETDEIGKRIKTDAYKAFLAKAGKNMSR